MQDVTTQRMQSKKIAEMLRTDPLTGVNNKAGMYDFFLNADTSCKASFFFINLDNFKYIYNSYGHETSDKYLKDIAGLIRDVVPDGVITRYSENEFFVMMPENLYEGQVRKRAKNLIDRASFITGYPDDIVQKCRVYIGALYDEELSEYIDTIVKKTEIAMFHAKESNSSRYYLSYGA